ncbi:nucleotide-binding domain-containing protein [Laetiporus sulphureus 93-53]|uniref:Nucleotide-binding domain-containing protein n=1 Tax=Laetiporus sulphureus 93-53 TaxID=1314785 RepID=A0A165FAW7_9APHY|nr:nucleotide-binding domain-containing protein [Laetiporus sulphureus 93-53]KZT08689.1 nucleotide-binding domain-containing protein [Laetiporus sulphureus 93-53]
MGDTPTHAALLDFPLSVLRTMSGNTKTPTEVVILGAGVIGLSVAYTLSSNSGDAYKIKIVARDMPEDLDSQAFSSPWAGANWSPMRGFDENTKRRELKTFNKLWDMIPTGRSMALPSRVYYDTSEDLSQLWYKDLVRDFRVMDKSELPEGVTGGVSFKTLSINPEVYLPWLKSELLARGVEFVRRKVQSLGEAAALAGPKGVLVNATGLGARSLIGVEDTNVYPIRGQTIIVYAPEIKEFISFPLGASDDGAATYIIPRPFPAGHVLLGGTYQLDDWDTSVSVPAAKGILARCTALAPQLASPETRILSHNVGLRPARKGGARVEAEYLDLPVKSELFPADTKGPKGRVLVVHAYGFGPAGYQNSWGAAEDVVELIKGNSQN